LNVLILGYLIEEGLAYRLIVVPRPLSKGKPAIKQPLNRVIS